MKSQNNVKCAAMKYKEAKIFKNSKNIFRNYSVQHSSSRPLHCGSIPLPYPRQHCSAPPPAPPDLAAARGGIYPPLPPPIGRGCRGGRWGAPRCARASPPQLRSPQPKRLSVIELGPSFDFVRSAQQAVVRRKLSYRRYYQQQPAPVII